ncbi:hypothetical protein L7F22_068455 [Adiantum nelumboides]|nr:hypothetical protein [Adiantum nelumboides]
MDSDHVCGTKVPTGDSFDRDQKVACSQSDYYGIVDDSDCDWGFDDPQVEMDEAMQVLVCHALSRVQKLKEASHACVVFEEESNLESWGSHDDMDMLNNLSWINVTNMYNAEENNTVWSFDSHDMNALCWNKSMERDWLCDTKFGHCVCPIYSSNYSFPFDHGKSVGPVPALPLLGSTTGWVPLSDYTLGSGDDAFNTFFSETGAEVPIATLLLRVSLVRAARERSAHEWRPPGMYEAPYEGQKGLAST